MNYDLFRLWGTLTVIGLSVSKPWMQPEFKKKSNLCDWIPPIYLEDILYIPNSQLLLTLSDGIQLRHTAPMDSQLVWIEQTSKNKLVQYK